MKFTIPTKQLKLIADVIAINCGKWNGGDFKMQFEHDGITIQTVDPANTWLSRIYIPKTSFRPYGQVIEPTSIGYNISDFADRLKHVDSKFGSLVTIDRDGLVCGPFSATLKSYDPDLSKGKYRIPAIPEMPKPRISFNMDMTLLHDTLKTLGGKCTFRHLFEYEQLSVKNNKTGDKVNLSDMVTLFEKVDEPVSTMIDTDEIDFIRLFGALGKFVGECTVSLDNDSALYLSANDDFNTHFNFMFAPCIEQ